MYLCFFFLHKDIPKKVPTKIIICAYWFMNLLLLAFYISNLSSSLTISTKYNDITNYKDATNKLVGAYVDYSSTLVKLGMKVKQYDNTLNSAVLMSKDLSNGIIDAAALPYASAIYVTNGICDYSIVGSIFVDSYLGFAFSPGIDPDLKQSFMQSFQGINDNLQEQALVNYYFSVTENDPCDNNLTVPLTVGLAMGPGVLIGIGILIALPLFFMYRKKNLVTRITSNENITQPTTMGHEKSAVDFINMMIKFECIMSSSKTVFQAKINELKEAIEENSKIEARYEELLKRLSFKIDSI